MKKLLLTLGSAAAAVAPVATVVACGSTDEAKTGSAKVDGTTLKITGFEGPTYAADVSDEDLAAGQAGFFNEMGESLRTVIGLEKATSVMLEGKVASESDLTKLVDVKLEVESMEGSGYTDIGDAWDYYADLSEAAGLTGPGQLFHFIYVNASHVTDEVETPAAVEGVMTAIAGLDLTTTHADDAAFGDGSQYFIDQANGDILALGLVADEITKVTDVLVADVTIDYFTYDATAQKMNVGLKYANETGTWDAAIGAITFTATP